MTIFRIGSACCYPNNPDRQYRVTNIYQDGSLQILASDGRGDIGRVSGVQPSALASPACPFCSFKIGPEDSYRGIKRCPSLYMHASCSLDERESYAHEDRAAETHEGQSFTPYA